MNFNILLTLGGSLDRLKFHLSTSTLRLIVRYIEEKDISSVFLKERIARRRGGLGLGLAICISNRSTGSAWS